MRTIFVISLLIQLLVSCFVETSSAKTPDTLAVIPFQVIGKTKNPNLFRFGFPDGLAHYLKNYDGIVVVNRIKLADVLREISLSQTGLFTSSKTQEIGQMIPANGIITGTVYTNGKNLRVNIHLIKVRTGELVKELTEKKRLDKTEQIFEFQEKVAQKFASSLNLKPKPYQKEAMAKIPKPSMEAYMHYVKALSYLYGGNLEMAKKESAWTLEIDPTFSYAKSFEEELESAFDELDRVIEEMKKEK